MDKLPERNRMQPRPGMPESFRDYLRQRWEAGCRHGRKLFAEIRKLGYKGCYSGLAKFLSPWRQPKAETRRAISGFPDAPQLQVTTLRISKPWSNGPVEGHINRLKMLKRQMYGRAGIELLRARPAVQPTFIACNGFS